MALITVNLEYEAHIGEDEHIEDGYVDCTVTADVSYGWNNIGYLASCVLQRTLDESCFQEKLYNQYRLSVTVEFKSTLTIEKWDAYYAFSVAVDLVVVTTMILPLILTTIATFFLLDFHGARDHTSMTI